jgi:hypothetical protein
VPIGSTDVTIPARTYLPVINTSGNSCNNLTIGAGGSLTINTGMNLTVNGNLTIKGSGNTNQPVKQQPVNQDTTQPADSSKVIQGGKIYKGKVLIQ